MRVYGYDRTSVWDKLKVSNDAQWQLICDKAKQDGHLKPQRYSEQGESGGSGNRTAFQQLRQEIISSDEQGILYFWRYDRIYRETRPALEFLQLCHDHNIEIVSIAEPFPSETSDLATKKVFIQLLFIHASMQREAIIENIKSGLAYKRSQGEYISSAVPYGYRLIEGEVVQELEEAKAVKRLFELYCSGEFGYKKLAQALAMEGYVFKEHPFTVRNVHSILGNSLYYGWIKGGTFGGYQGNFTPIITKKAFDQAQAIRKSRQVTKTDQRVYPLRKKINCPHCHRRLSPKFQYNHAKTQRLYYYHCANRECKGVFLRAEQIEQAVIDNLKEFLQRDGIYAELLTAVEQEIHQMKKKEHIEKRAVYRNKTAIIEQFEKGEITIEKMKQELHLLSEISNESQSGYIKKYEEKLQELLLLKKITIQKIVMDQLDYIEVSPAKEIQGIYLVSINENIMRKGV
ncbi:recombinase family protein [Enterococcus sp. BWR-S5]|uniref:recombinase family protein n=1 Tax=Enterococcus sp. BWR-S5 TaxID=2787714 RepID=UPI0019239E9A|nr:recombinase family protein [Enterococcus sp. BWR-S5]MBL1224204.1 recombinase family protein [Enterococcus sp. BWR-S5]